MSRSQSQVKPFADALGEIRKRVEIECFSGEERDMAEELCLIITELFFIPDGASVRIGGTDLPAPLVREIYSRVRSEHLRGVIDKFRRADYPIKYKKTYLRTALYNRVFEQESGAANDFYSTFFGGR